MAILSRPLTGYVPPPAAGTGSNPYGLPQTLQQNQITPWTSFMGPDVGGPGTGGTIQGIGNVNPQSLQGWNWGQPLNFGTQTGDPKLTQGSGSYNFDPSTNSYTFGSYSAPQASDAGSLFDKLIQGATMTGLAAVGGLAGGAALGATGNATTLFGGANPLFGAAAGGGTAPLTYASVPGSWAGPSGAQFAGPGALGAGGGAGAGAGADLTTLAETGGGLGAAGGGAGSLFGAGSPTGTGLFGATSYGSGPLDALNTGAGGVLSSDASGLANMGAGAVGSAGSGGGLLNKMINIPGIGDVPLSTLQMGGSLLSSGIGALGSISAANTLSDAANKATNLQNQIYQQTLGNLAPYRTAGAGAIGQLGGYLNDSPTGGPGGGPGLLHQFGASDLQANLAPNYNFQLGQGMGQIQNQQAAAGGAMGGNSLAGLNSFAQNYAQNAYQNAFSNYQTNQGNIYNRLLNVGSLGENAASGGTTGAPTFAQGMAGTITGAGSAGAAGTVGATNAVTGGLSNLLGYYTLAGLTSKNNPQGG
jgi:hypothetical protein